jgi:acetoin utilization protein AcuC
LSGSAAAEGAVEPIVIVHGPSLTSYSFGHEHPLQPTRHELTMSLLAMLGWLDAPELSVETPRPATLSELLTAHSLPYIQAVQTAQSIARGERPSADLRIYGLGIEDNPLFPSMHEAPALLAGASAQAMQAVLEGRAVHAYSPAGGMHHAMRARAAGFCIYNDIVVAIAAALDQDRRVAYVDLDAHHGDGVQAAFYDDPRVLTVSVHESGEFLYPGTGEASETGIGEGRGACINVPLPPHSGDESILLAYDRIVEPALVAYAPDVIVTQTGCDTHHADPLTDLAGTMRLYPALAARTHAIAHRICAGRWLIVGGGGYDPADVTPRAWGAFMGTVLGHQVDEVVLPVGWRIASEAKGGHPPLHLLDDPEAPAPRAPDPSFVASLDRIEAEALAALRKRFAGESATSIEGAD